MCDTASVGDIPVSWLSGYNPSWAKDDKRPELANSRERLTAIRRSAWAYFDDASRLEGGETSIDPTWIEGLTVAMGKEGTILRTDIKEPER